MSGSISSTSFVHAVQKMNQREQPFDVRFVERAAAAFADQHYFTLSLGLHFAEQGNWPAAVKWLEESQQRLGREIIQDPQNKLLRIGWADLERDVAEARQKLLS